MITGTEPDIWSYTDHYIVIPTNIGWKSNGMAVMGAGLAKQAAQYYMEILPWYGMKCKKYGADTPVVMHPARPLIFFPTKPLDVQTPHASWKQPASLELIQSRLPQLAQFESIGCPIAVPMLGCGLGGLDPKVVHDMCAAVLSDKFVWVGTDI